MSNTWLYKVDVRRRKVDLTDFEVKATDGGIGSIDEEWGNRESGCLIVETGFWILGKRRLIPVGVVREIDYDAEKVYLSMTKDEVRRAPDYDEAPNNAGTHSPRDVYEPYFSAFSWRRSPAAEENP